MKTTNLMLSRKPNQSIRVDGPAEFTIVNIAGQRAKVLTQAPESTRVIRGELEFSNPIAQHPIFDQTPGVATC